MILLTTIAALFSGFGPALVAEAARKRDERAKAERAELQRRIDDARARAFKAPTVCRPNVVDGLDTPRHG